MAPKPRKQKPPNPISAAVRDWVDQSGLDVAVEILVAEAPKRWVDYEPMVLLPSGSFTTAAWAAALAQASEDCRLDLWERILRGIGNKASGRATHLAVNDGIPLTITTTTTEPPSGSPLAPPTSNADEDSENILRSPVGLRTLYGDFGPTETQEAAAVVTQQDFDRAFWVSTKQNGIYQTWAPRWTMFSRGNVKEKARLLAFHDAPAATAEPTTPAEGEGPSSPPPPWAHRARSGPALAHTWAVDLYAGIGYFVFSYARLGMRVLCWELNPWSVEGLRRGAAANGWSVRVVRRAEELARPARELVAGGERIVVFLQDNRHAARRVQELRACGLALPVSHVNCGLLPRSEDSWGVARAVLLGAGEEGGAGWLHLHENVGAEDIERRRDEIQDVFARWDRRDGRDRAAEVEHVELVKTFAPSVWHCVFDVYIKTF